jgi:hypothetical protein
MAYPAAVAGPTFGKDRSNDSPEQRYREESRTIPDLRKTRGVRPHMRATPPVGDVVS